MQFAYQAGTLSDHNFLLIIFSFLTFLNIVPHLTFLPWSGLVHPRRCSSSKGEHQMIGQGSITSTKFSTKQVAAPTNTRPRARFFL